MPPSHNGIAPVLRTGPFGLPGSIPGGGVYSKKKMGKKILWVIGIFLLIGIFFLLGMNYGNSNLSVTGNAVYTSDDKDRLDLLENKLENLMVEFDSSGKNETNFQVKSEEIIGGVVWLMGIFMVSRKASEKNVGLGVMRNVR